MSVFTLTRPTQGDIPVLVEVPHAGLTVPSAVRVLMTASQVNIQRDADIHVDALCAGAVARGATLLTASCSRYVVDLNRAPDDVDLETVKGHPSPVAVQPRGVVWRLTTDGRVCLPRPLTYPELQERLVTYYAPYHLALRTELARLRSRFGWAVLLAAHSMPSVGRAGHADTGQRRADVVPGTRGRSTAHGRLIDAVDAHFRAAGLSVRHDDPYRGGFTTGHYGKPRDGVHAIQIELNRGLYVNEDTFEIREPGFTQLATLLDGLVDTLGAWRPA